MEWWPSSITEGGGIVDVVIGARTSDGAAVTGTALTITLTVPTSADYTVLGHVLNRGAATESTATGVPPLTIAVGETATAGVLRLEVPADADSAEEQITISVAVSGNENYVAPAPFTVTIAAAQLPMGTTRHGQKQIQLALGINELGWDVGNAFAGDISSRSFTFAVGEDPEETYTLNEMRMLADRSQLTLVVDKEFPSRMTWRITSRGIVTDLAFGRATESAATDDGQAWRYRWSTSGGDFTLPNVARDEWVSVAVMDIAEATAFADDASIPDQVWTRLRFVELPLPRVVAGNGPITYTMTGISIWVTPSTDPDSEFLESNDMRIARARIDLPRDRGGYDGTYPVLIGAPAAEWRSMDVTLTAEDADGETDTLSFTAAVTPRPPHDVVLRPKVRGFRLAWQIGNILGPGGVSISGYRVETAAITGNTQLTPQFTNFELASGGELTGSSRVYEVTDQHTESDVTDGLLVAYRVRTVSNAGVSPPSGVVWDWVTNDPVAARVVNLRAREHGLQDIRLRWSITPESPDAMSICQQFIVRRTAVAEPQDSDWTILALRAPVSAENNNQNYRDQDSTLQSSTTYYYQVAQTRSEGACHSGDFDDFIPAGWSNTASITTSGPDAPPKPAGQHAPQLTVHRQRITIEWAAGLSGGDAEIEGYLLQFALTEDGPWQDLKPNPSARYTARADEPRRFEHTELDPSRAYYYRLRASNAIGDGEFSDAVSARPAPADALLPVLSLANPSVAREFEVTITFNKPVTEFWPCPFNFCNVLRLDLSPSTAAFIRDSWTVVSERVYTVRIRASEAVEHTIFVPPGLALVVGGSEHNIISDVLRVTPDFDPPTAHTYSLAPATVSGPFDVIVRMSERVRVGTFTDDDVEVTNATVAGPNRSGDRRDFTFTVTPTMPGPVSLRVKGRVTDAAGNENRSLSTAWVTRTYVQLQPGQLRAVGGPRSVSLLWQPPSTPGTGNFEGYLIERSPQTSPDAWTTLVMNTGNPNTTYRDNGTDAVPLDDSTTYRYQVYTRYSGDPPEAWVATNVATGTTWTAADANNDGRVTVDDGLVFAHVLRGLPADPIVWRTLLEPYLAEPVDATIQELIARGAPLNLADVNEDTNSDQLDAELIYNVLAFPELVGNGRSLPGFDRFREILIEPYRGSSTVEQIIRTVHKYAMRR